MDGGIINTILVEGFQLDLSDGLDCSRFHINSYSTMQANNYEIGKIS